MTREQRARAFASHLALRTRGPRHGPFTLFDKYGERRKIGGPYRSVAALERAVERHLERLASGQAKVSTLSKRHLERMAAENSADRERAR